MCSRTTKNRSIGITRPLPTSNDYPTAMNNVGIMYWHGLGVSKDHEAAAYWYKRGVALNDEHAMYNLGLAYERGSGVSKDNRE